MANVAGETQTSALPRVSVCTSVYNQGEWLKDTISSIIASSYENWEMLIVDDASDKEPSIQSVVESFNDKRIQFFKFESNRGVPHGSNFLIPKCRGEYICIIAADEWIWKDKFKVQMDYLDKNPRVDCVWGIAGRFNQLPITGDMGPRPEWEMYVLRSHNRSKEAWIRTLVMLDGVPLGGCGFMMRKRVIDELGGFNPELTTFSDHDLYCRFFEKYTGMMIPYLVARDKEPTPDCVRARNQENWDKELSYVRAQHPIVPPISDGKVTVGIPCYNHAKYLPAAIESVLTQTRAVDEIIILDDCSTDDFKTVVQQFTDPRIKVIAFEENQGYAEAHNYLAIRATGDFLALVSADDTIAPTYIEKCLAKFKQHPWFEMVASQNDFMNEDGSQPLKRETEFEKQLVMIPKIIERPRELQLQALRPGNHYFGSGMYRLKNVFEVGGWEKEYGVIADYQMYLKLLQREPIGIVEEPLTHTRIHSANHSKIEGKRVQELPWLYHKARARFWPLPMKLIICTPFYELKGFSPYIESLVNTVRILQQIGIDFRFMQLSGDSYVHRARNTMCDVFLQDPDATDLFFIDSDMSWNPEAFVKMCLLSEPVLGGSYPVKNGWDRWTSIPKVIEENGQFHMKGRELGDGSALIEAHVLAGGFLRIKRHVLLNFREKFPELWYHEPSTDPATPDRKYTQFFAAESENHQFIGEDHMFSKRMRDMGMPMFIYPNVDLTHWGYKNFDGNLDKFLKEQKKLAQKPIQAQITRELHPDEAPA